MAIVQISKIIHRTGSAVELPQLDIGEIGFASDEQRVFIGNDPSWVPPEGINPTNTEILTNSPNCRIDFAQVDGVFTTTITDIKILGGNPGDVLSTDSSGTLSWEAPTSTDGLASESYVDTQISNLVDTAPSALNTLNELAAALNDDSNFASTVTTSLAAKANSADLATVATSGLYTDLTGTPDLFDGDYASLTNTPDLGTAALTDSTAYATAAQGLLADSAMQPGNDVSMLTNDVGYITVSSVSWTNLSGAPTFATVSTTGSYSDLTGTPSIPDDLSDLTDTTNLLTAYTPAIPGDWNSPPPSTIGEAIDRLAALVKTLNSGTGA